MAEQLFFDLDFRPVKSVDPTPRRRNGRRAIQRAVLRWLEETTAPTGMAADVITRVSRLKADVAAFWSQPERNPHNEGPHRIMRPVRTTLVQCHLEREECWPDCTRSNEILPKLKAMKAEMAQVQETIHQTEPHLRDGNSLFVEYAEWRYEESTNPDYHRLRRAIEKLEHGLYHGTKFERIRQAQVADCLYLAVPSGLVEPDEMADGWGLLWVEQDLTVRERVPAEARDCMAENRMHLIQNLAAACRDHTLMAHGVAHAKGDVFFVKPFVRRRGTESPELEL
jgi:hypothetical protein